jgi:hypothetical protein
MNKPQSQSIRLLLALLCCLLLTLPALAQTPEPTARPTPDGTLAAPTPEIETPVIPAPDPVVYASSFDRIIDLLIAVVLAGGAVAVVKAFRDPERGKQYVTFGIELLQMAAKFTPTPNDDKKLGELMDAWQKAIAPLVAEGARAALSEAMAEERAKLVTQTGNKVDALSVVPQPDVKA